MSSLVACVGLLFCWLQPRQGRRKVEEVGCALAPSGFLEVDRLLLEGVESGLDGLQVDVFELQTEVAANLELGGVDVEADPAVLCELAAALEHLDELRAAAREMRARAAAVALWV